LIAERDRLHLVIGGHPRLGIGVVRIF